jgi:agmatinase
MTEVIEEGQFLGLPQSCEVADMVVVPLAYELTTSYGVGACDGPAACVQASAQVELYDDQLGQDIPAGYHLQTLPVWEGSAPTLRGQLDELADHVAPFYNGQMFPLFLGGEHGILPPIMQAARRHPLVDGDLSKLTVVQLDAHADLRSELDGEPFSHACAASRSLDVGIGRLLQAGIRAYSKEEAERINSDERITTYFAKETQHPHHGADAWQRWLRELRSIEGPVHLTVDIDGLDGALVPATGTPVPGGLSYWQAVETIEVLFGNPNATVISADVNEIVAQADTPLTQFTAACLATKMLASHLLARQEGRWTRCKKSPSDAPVCAFFSQF